MENQSKCEMRILFILHISYYTYFNFFCDVNKYIVIVLDWMQIFFPWRDVIAICHIILATNEET